jgi:hypothetical protein
VVAPDHAAMAPALLPCSHCGCHAKSTETRCPSCGEPIRREDGSVQRTAVAVLLGLTAAGALAGACSSSATVALYGAAVTTSTTSGGAGGGGTGGSGTGTSDGGAG